MAASSPKRSLTTARSTRSRSTATTRRAGSSARRSMTKPTGASTRPACTATSASDDRRLLTRAERDAADHRGGRPAEAPQRRRAQVVHVATAKAVTDAGAVGEAHEVDPAVAIGRAFLALESVAGVDT